MTRQLLCSATLCFVTLKPYASAHTVSGIIPFCRATLVPLVACIIVRPGASVLRYLFRLRNDRSYLELIALVNLNPRLLLLLLLSIASKTQLERQSNA